MKGRTAEREGHTHTVRGKEREIERYREIFHLLIQYQTAIIARAGLFPGSHGLPGPMLVLGPKQTGHRTTAFPGAGSKVEQLGLLVTNGMLVP